MPSTPRTNPGKRRIITTATAWNHRRGLWQLGKDNIIVQELDYGTYVEFDSFCDILYFYNHNFSPQVFIRDNAKRTIWFFLLGTRNGTSSPLQRLWCYGSLVVTNSCFYQNWLLLSNCWLKFLIELQHF